LELASELALELAFQLLVMQFTAMLRAREHSLDVQVAGQFD
jgi:hypothetical protein